MPWPVALLRCQNSYKKWVSGTPVYGFGSGIESDLDIITYTARIKGPISSSIGIRPLNNDS